MAPLASIIICTRNRAASLDRTLRGLLDDDSATDRELVIVDNASSDRTRLVAEAAAATAGFPVVIVSESRPGLSRARNAGVRRASGEFLLFTDDDIVVRPGWVDALVAPFASGDVAVTGGRVIPVHPRPLAPWMRGTHLDRIALTDYGPSDREMLGDALPYGANFALRRSVLPPEDPFPPFLGHSGAVGISYEEWHVVQSLAREHRIVYAPKAVVEHHYDAAKLDYDSFRRSYFQSGFGYARHERMVNPVRVRFPRRAVEAVRAYSKALAIRRRNARVRELTPEVALSEFEAYFWAGIQVESLCQREWRLANWLAARLV
jgi:glycosyltransferase involved in cell wall biosynthesis